LICQRVIPAAANQDVEAMVPEELIVGLLSVIALQSPAGQWVDERLHAGAVRHRRADHGDLAAPQAGRPHASIRSGEPIYKQPDAKLLTSHGITCSMSRSGNVWERAIEGAVDSSPMASAVMESFFSSLKTERTARKTYRFRDEAKVDVFDYIERFYNPKRRHSTLGYLSPIEFEASSAPP
jgi:transposase InsO family protein